MNILFIAPSAYLLGGVQDWLSMLVMGLRDRGHRITVGVPDGHFHQLKPFNAQYPGLNAKGFINKTGTEAGRRRALMTFLLDHPADLVVGVNIGDLYEAFALIAARLPRTRLALTLHAIEADYFADIKTYAPILDGIITTNRLTEAMVKAVETVPEERVFYAPYGVTEGPVRVSAGARPLRIAWVGRIENGQKRVSDLPSILHALDHAKCDYRLSIAGLGPCLEELQQLLSPWIQHGKVAIEGYIEKAKIPDFLVKHDVMLITSQWETGPIVAWEAMAAGLVVVSSSYVGSWLERALIHDSTALLYPIGDAHAASLQLIRLAHDPLREKLVRNGRQMALSRYSTQASLLAWERALEEILLLPRQVKLLPQPCPRSQPAGRLDRLLGPSLAERLRALLPLQPFVPDSGSEWPHAMHHITDQTALLNHAKEVESAAVTCGAAEA
ncbi:MAG: glycosyltransferase family 4 protein [Synechococcaceae cyanobacterium]